MNQEVTLSTHKMITLQAFPVHSTTSLVDQLIQRIGRERFEMWFGGQDSVRLLESDHGRMAVGIYADSEFSLSRIKGTFGNDLRNVVNRILGPEVSIEFHLTKEPEIPSPPFDGDNISLAANFVDGQKSCSIASIPATRFANDNPLDSRGHQSKLPIVTAKRNNSPKNDQPIHRGVKSFWFGEENRLAEASVSQILEQPGHFSPLLVYGPTGCGKTELLQAIVNDYRTRLRQRRCVMVSAEQFTSQFVSSLRGGSGLPMFRRKFRDLDLLVIDDIQFLLGKKATANEFQQTIDSLIRAGKQVVLASDRSPIELSSCSEELGNRMAGGLSCPLRYPGLEGRIKIAHRICKTRHMSFSKDVIELVCSCLTRDIRRISGALNRLHALAISSGRKITVELASQELAELFSFNFAQSTSLINIESVVCEVCGIKPSELKSKKRQKSISSARMLAMYLSREFTTSACSEIGDYFGGRSHSTVIAAHKKVANWIENDAGISLPNTKLRAKEIIDRLQVNLRVG